MVVPFEDLEIKGIMVNGMGFIRAVYAWNKISINYALSIWSQNFKNFHAFDYIICNNEVMKDKWYENNLKIFCLFEYII